MKTLNKTNSISAAMSKFQYLEIIVFLVYKPTVIVHRCEKFYNPLKSTEKSSD